MISRMIRCKWWGSHQLVAAFIWENKTSSIGVWKTKPWRVKEVQPLSLGCFWRKQAVGSGLSWQECSNPGHMNPILCPDLLLPLTWLLVLRYPTTLLFFFYAISLQWSQIYKNHNIKSMDGSFAVCSNPCSGHQKNISGPLLIIGDSANKKSRSVPSGKHSF